MPGPLSRPLLAVVLPLAAAAVLLTAPARADDLTLTTRELGGWNEALAVLRGDLESEGARIHVGVLSGGSRVPCGRYRLQLDAAAAQAFRVGGCDPGMGETLLVLEHRAALFDERFHVPRPRTLSISAILEATAVAGGGPQGGSVVRCSWAVRPYLDDLQHGKRVLLTPEHYALRSAGASVTTAPDGSGWTLHASSATLDLEYEVTDLATGEVVLRQKTALSCGAASPGAEPLAPAPGEPARELPAKDPAPPGPSVVFTAIPPAASAECPWGRTRKGGCSPNPKPWAIAFTSLGLAATGGAATAFYYAGKQPGGALHSGLMAPAVFGTLCAVAWSATGIALWARYADGMATGPVVPTVAVSGQGASLGLGGRF